MNLPISTDPVPDDLVSATEGAKAAGCHVATLYRWIARGTLRAWQRAGKGGRVYVSEADVCGLFRPVSARAKVLPLKVPKPAAVEAGRRRDAAELDALGI